MKRLTLPPRLWITAVFALGYSAWITFIQGASEISIPGQVGVLLALVTMFGIGWNMAKGND